MAFGYRFLLTLDESQRQQRRQLLAYYATVAQISFLAVLVAIRIYFALSWLEHKWLSGGQDARPGSPYVKHMRLASSTSWSARARRHWQRWRWWFGEPVSMGWGTTGGWLTGGVWMAWLLLLCYVHTAPDYLHLTKRFGIVGASQLPFHYLLAMKSPRSPLQLITRMSHEELNTGHRILGRIIHICLALHAGFYLNFFILSNLLGKRIRDRDVILGLTSIFVFTVVGTTALGFLRRWSYRVFYVTHVFAATILLPLLYFHVHYIRPFIWETVAIYLANALLRFFNTRTCSGKISLIPNTNLIQVNIPVTSSTGKWKPGQHLYLSLPARQSSDIWGLHRLRTNPFTVASIPNEDGRLLLVARALNGNTRRLVTHAQTALSCRYCESQNLPCHVPDSKRDDRCNNCRCCSRPLHECGMEGAVLSLMIEGPYGASARLPDFLLFDRVLLVAGGVGATFIAPIWRHIVNTRQRNHLQKDGDVRFVWAVKTLAETSWAFPCKQRESKRGWGVEGVEIHVTGQPAVNDGAERNGEIGFEMAERDELTGENDTCNQGLLEQGIVVKYIRPDLYEVVNETFSGHAEKVAVLVCGPTRMGTQLRKHVGKWVRRGKDVYWHAETFGF